MTKSLVSFLACLPLAAATAGAAEAPNVLLILADDLGYASLSCYGSERVKTPNIDRLASEGVRFTQFYSASAECTPSRTALLTGRYPQRVGGMECAIGVGGKGRYDDAAYLAEKQDLGLPPERSVLPSVLNQQGYHSAVIGKWHLGYEPKFNPLEHGWESFVGLIGGNADYFHHTESSDDPTRPGEHVLFRDRTRIHDDRYLTHLITDETIDWLDRAPAERPFFLYMAQFAPHNPQQGPNDRRPTPLIGPEFNRNDPEKYRAVIEALDASVGRVLAKLEELGRAENTIVIFTSDNGPIRMGETQPFRGLKGTLQEGGIRVPCIIRWPGRIQPGTTTNQVATTMDLTYSMLRYSGADPVRHGLDGRDIIGQLADGRPDEARTLFFRYRRGAVVRKAIREGDLKLIENHEGGSTEVLMYDLAADPGEANNLASHRTAEVKRLQARIAAWEAEVQPPPHRRVPDLRGDS